LWGPYTLDVEFNDGSSQNIDFLPVLAGELFAPLRDLAFFNRVQLDDQAGTLVWPNGADFDPAMLHDWAERGVELRELTSEWSRTEIQ